MFSPDSPMIRPAAPYAMISPVLILIGVILLYPILYGLYMSVTIKDTLSGEVRFVGLENYIYVFSNRNFINSLVNSLVLVAGSMALGIVFAMGFALVLFKAPMGRLWRTVVLVPYLISGIAGAAMWRYLFAPNTTPFNGILARLNLDAPLWLGDNFWAMFVLILCNTWFITPFSTLIIYAGLHTVDESLYEASSIDGASPWNQFRYVTIPAIMPHFALALIFLSFASFNTFEVILILTGGGPGRATEVLAVSLYEVGFRQLDFSAGAVYMVVLLALNLALSIVYLRLLPKD